MGITKTTRGFTIVELLIVIVVIAILATISIVAYNGIQKRTNQSVVKNDFATIRKTLEMYKITNGSYPTSATITDVIEVSKTSYRTDIYNVFYIATTSGDRYCIAASAKGESSYDGYRMCDGGALQVISDMNGAGNDASLVAPSVSSIWLYYGSDGWRI